MTKRKPPVPSDRGRGQAPGKPPSASSASETDKQRGSDAAKTSVVTGIVLTGVGILGLAHLIASFVPGIRTWGIDYWSEFPVIVRLCLALLLGAAMARSFATAVDRGVTAALKLKWARIAGIVFLAAAFIVFRSRGLSYGDGYSFLVYFPDGKLPTFDAHLSTQFLDIVLHWVLYRFVLLPLGGGVQLSYAIWGALGGLVGLWALGRIASALARDIGARRLIVAAAVTSGAMVMWFGHVESYTLVNAALLWAIAFAIESQQTRGRIWAAWGTWLLAMGLHQLALAFLPALIWAHWRSRRRASTPTERSTAAALLGVGFLAWAIATFLQRQVGLPIFVPVTVTRETAYSAFSIAHLSDALNLLLFLAPAGAIGLVVWFIKDRQEKAEHIVAGILAVTAASAWYFAFWIDPLIGAFRDWDLLAAFGPPLSIWAAVTILHRYHGGTPPRWLWVPVAALGLVHSGAFVGAMQDEMRAALRVDRLVREDVHYTPEFFSGTRLPPWAAIIGRSLERYDLARDHLALRVSIDPTDALAWANLGNAYRKLSMPDSALWCYRQASDRDSTNEKYANNLSVLYMEQNDYLGAEYAIRRVVALSDTAYGARATLGLICLNLGKTDEAKKVLDEAIKIHPDQYLAYYNRGLVEETLADTAAALADYHTAVKYAPGNRDAYTRIVQIYQWSGQTLSAIDAARRWQREDPNSATAIFLEGTCHYMVGEYKLARSTFERVLLLSPKDALTMYYLASTHRNLGEVEVAKQYAKHATDTDPNLALPYLELVYIAADKGDHAAAVAATREYLKRAPSDSGMAYLQQFMER